MPTLSSRENLCMCRRADVVVLVLDASECAGTGAERFTITLQRQSLSNVSALATPLNL